jgi:integrase
MARRLFGTARRLPSKRWQATYIGPDGARYTAPTTFDTKGDAGTWLDAQHTDIARDQWASPAAAAAARVLFADYATGWLAARELKPSTRAHYRRVLATHLLPAFGSSPLRAITPAAVRGWYGQLGEATGPTARAHAYGLLRTIMRTAADDDMIAASPCRVRGGGAAKRARTVTPATLAELETIAAAMPEAYRLLVLVASWCALRYGEAVECRRRDVDLAAAVIRVRRGVTRVDGHRIVGSPKSAAGVRDVTIPPHLLPAVRAHLAEHTAIGPDALLFPSRTDPTRHLSPSSMQDMYYPAREAAGRPELRFHELRHTGATLAAATGATLAELMDRLGHSTPAAAMRYQHASADRARVIAAALSDLAAAAPVVSIDAGRA